MCRFYKKRCGSVHQSQRMSPQRVLLLGVMRAYTYPLFFLFFSLVFKPHAMYFKPICEGFLFWFLKCKKLQIICFSVRRWRQTLLVRDS